MFFLPDWMWAYDYPNNVIDSGSSAHVTIDNCTWRYCTKLSPKVYPTSVYEFIMATGLGGFLWAIRKKVTIPGMLFCIYLIFNGLERFWIEKIRVNDEIPLLGMNPSQAEIISFLLFFTGIMGCIIVYQRSRKPSSA